MSAIDLIDALALPADARVDQRVPKKLLLEQGAPTAADKRHIQEGIEEITWVAALKPVTIGVPGFQDGTREYVEIAVLRVTQRPQAKAARLTELIHRAIPYPLVLVTVLGESATLSLSHKRASQATGAAVVLDGALLSATVASQPSALEATFLASLRLAEQFAQNLFELYQGWIDRVMALEAARITGTYVPPQSATRSAAVREGLDAYARLTRELVALRAQAGKEKQMNRRVDLNLRIKQLETELTTHTDILRTTSD